MIKVVFVEDNDDIRDIARLSFDLSGIFEVQEFSSGAECLAQSSGLAPDIFLLDVMMPGMSGPDLLVALRAIDRFSSVPVVFLTARANQDELADLYSLGVSDVITKPFDPRSLCERVETAARGAFVREK